MESPHFHHLNSSDFEKLKDIVYWHGTTFWLPVLQAVESGMALAIVHRESKHFAVPKRRPFLAIVGDDDHASTGPIGFRRKVIRSVFKCAGLVMVHAAAGTEFDYQIAVDMAVSKGYAVIVETSSDKAEEWVAAVQQFAPRAKIIVVEPGDGKAHPCCPPIPSWFAHHSH